ncbi:MAG: hypothetical protein MZU97_06905 [Bacillus subtilis]|nr:hypothetical protein [Bacillus subtilis]
MTMTSSGTEAFCYARTRRRICETRPNRSIIAATSTKIDDLDAKDEGRNALLERPERQPRRSSPRLNAIPARALALRDEIKDIRRNAPD